MKAFIKTYGCQMNEQDSLQMKGLLTRIGYVGASEPFDADLILMVTCSIREKAVHKVYSDLGRLRPLVENNPNRIIGLAGCVAQQEKENLLKRFPFLDLVFGPDAIGRLPEMVDSVRRSREEKKRRPIVETRFSSRKDFEFVNLIAQDDEGKVKAYVTIQKGCDNICSFCIVPSVRGSEVSRPSDDIVKEVRELVSLGVKEVTLLGQNVNSYGKKFPGEISFVRLLRRIAAETDIQRLRFTSSHPQDVGDDLVECYADLKVLCSHFHLPVQSGSNKVLAAMRRYYTRENYLDIIRKLKGVRPDIAITTDLIVGFPGETEEDFRQTLGLVREVGFDLGYSFVYSQRPGTKAARIKDDVTLAEKETRLGILQALQTEVAQSKNNALLHKVVEVLVEKEDDFGQNLITTRWLGRTSSNKIVHISIGPAARELIGETVAVRITKANPYSLVGEVV
ncbi:MAG: tRNA (N6-isopentenyl adenosine(37)-C2)-methylthiotransferase MiaB [Deltaproteobacteria bacterium]|nr:tRNA (N6-isopentenyl adenosine(37)-C2)-methylthiotransferase MiaB [Deltaproteobacteria bacterium]